MSADLIQENTELTDQQMDELVSKTENSGRPVAERAMTKEEETKPAEDIIEFKHNNKTIKGTRDQLIKWAQMGIDYPTKAQQLNQEKAKWEQQRQQWEQKYTPYKQIDEWATKNPDQWTRLQQAYQQAQQGLTPQGSQPQTAAEFQAIQMLNQKIQQLEQKINPIEENLNSSKQQAEDQQLDQIVTEIRGKYKDIDWDTPDDNGKPLEYRVLEFAQENGIKRFDTAFKAYYHDELVQRAEAQAKQNVSKDIQTKTKMGLLGTTSKPTRGVQAVKDVKNKSYENIMGEIREELASGAYN